MASKLQALQNVASKIPQLNSRAAERSRIAQQTLLQAAGAGQAGVGTRAMAGALGTQAAQQEGQLSTQEAQERVQIDAQTREAEAQQQRAEQQAELQRQQNIARQQVQKSQIASAQRLQEKGQMLDTKLVDEQIRINEALAKHEAWVQDKILNEQNSFAIEEGQRALKEAEQFAQFAISDAQSQEELQDYEQILTHSMQARIDSLKFAMEIKQTEFMNQQTAAMSEKERTVNKQLQKELIAMDAYIREQEATAKNIRTAFSIASKGITAYMTGGASLLGAM